MSEDCFVIGNGIVGQATRKALDIPYYFDLKESNITLNEGAKKKWCFICLPTPTDEKESQAKAIDVIRDYIKQIKQMGSPIFVIRSTVLPGTCRALAETTGAVVVSNPEFLSESKWEEDAIHPRIKVIGADDIAIRRGLVSLWQRIKCKLEVTTDSTTAEMIKYVMNTFAVVKVVYANQIYDACDKVKADYEVIHHVLHSHPWGSKEHLRVIDKGGRGAGGKCLPKDIKAFAKFSSSPLLDLVKRLNEEYLTKSKKQ